MELEEAGPVLLVDVLGQGGPADAKLPGDSFSTPAGTVMFYEALEHPAELHFPVIRCTPAGKRIERRDHRTDHD